MSTHTGRSAASKEPHWMTERDVLRDLRDLEHEASLQQIENEQADPTYAAHDWRTGGEE